MECSYRDCDKSNGSSGKYKNYYVNSIFNAALGWANILLVFFCILILQSGARGIGSNIRRRYGWIFGFNGKLRFKDPFIWNSLLWLNSFALYFFFFKNRNQILEIVKTTLDQLRRYCTNLGVQLSQIKETVSSLLDKVEGLRVSTQQNSNVIKDLTNKSQKNFNDLNEKSQASIKAIAQTSLKVDEMKKYLDEISKDNALLKKVLKEIKEENSLTKANSIKLIEMIEKIINLGSSKVLN